MYYLKYFYSRYMEFFGYETSNKLIRTSDEGSRNTNKSIIQVITKHTHQQGILYIHIGTVLMYGIKSWVMKGEMLKIMEGFHHRSARRIARMTMKLVTDGMGEYTPVVAALEAVGLYPVQEYILIRQVLIVAQVACWHIYELCTKAEQRPRKSRMIRWWDQDMVQESNE